jgi:hypothetical protein
MLTNPIDYKKVATDLCVRAIERVVTVGGNMLSQYWQKHKASDIATYTQYLIRKGVQANSIRNFIYANKSASLYDIYVPTSFSTESEYRSRNYSGDALLENACSTLNSNPQRRPTMACVVQGSAGTGKTLFMRHAFFAVQNMKPFRIPILIEARSFNRLPLADLQQRITDDIASTGASITYEQVRLALEAGLFFIILDGIDELRTGLYLDNVKSIQDHYGSELEIFALKFPLCPVFVSTRPMNRVYSWSQFEVRAIAPLSRDEAIDLVDKLEFHPQVKRKFKGLLRTGLFKSHKELVSVPLLCTIMLLTYAETGYIAKHRHEFFEDAFNALWSKHDGRKDGFVRERQSGLKKSEFLRLLSGFAMSSYSSADYDIREASIDKHFNTAVRLSGISCEQENFLQDFTTATSLGIFDGPYLRFCHRSFQEYFTAVFLSQVEDEVVGQLIEEVSDRLETDNVLPLLLSINPEKLEKYWVEKRLDCIERKICQLDFKQYGVWVRDSYIREPELYKMMSQIRFLYRLGEGIKYMEAALDAHRHISFSEGRVIDPRVLSRGRTIDESWSQLLEQDYLNFMELAERIRNKYVNKSSAISELLNSGERHLG